jgi:hypothetical protein
MRNTRALRFLRSLRLRLRRCRHERDERVTNGALHGVLGRAVERDAIDHGADDDTPTHELADRLADVFVVPAEAVNPANNERVAVAKQVEQAPPLRPFAELRAHAGYEGTGERDRVLSVVSNALLDLDGDVRKSRQVRKQLLVPTWAFGMV